MHYCYRSGIDIITSILNTANGSGVKQLEILDRSRLTHKIFRKYLYLILQFGLIEHFQLQGRYKTTERGIQFLYIYDEMKNLTQ
jgi:predicted transcriptional regulator